MPSLTLPCAPPLCGGAGVRERKLCSSLSSHSAQPRLAPLGRQRAHLVSRRHAATVEVSTGPEQEDEEEDEPYPVPSAEDAVHGLGQATATVAGRHLRERMWCVLLFLLWKFCPRCSYSHRTSATPRYSESDPAPTYQVRGETYYCVSVSFAVLRVPGETARAPLGRPFVCGAVRDSTPRATRCARSRSWMQRV